MKTCKDHGSDAVWWIAATLAELCGSGSYCDAVSCGVVEGVWTVPAGVCDSLDRNGEWFVDWCHGPGWRESIELGWWDQGALPELWHITHLIFEAWGHWEALGARGVLYLFLRVLPDGSGWRLGHEWRITSRPMPWPDRPGFIGWSGLYREDTVGGVQWAARDCLDMAIEEIWQAGGPRAFGCGRIESLPF